jgi:sulfite reductase alpha subunit-like flavoprotein
MTSAGERPALLVVYASQTGNAQDAAERLGREAEVRHYVPTVVSAAACTLLLLAQARRAVFVVSTTGQVR